jgi:hypothetical protein
MNNMTSLWYIQTILDLAASYASRVQVYVTTNKYSFSFCSILFHDVPFSSSLFFQNLLSVLSRSKFFHLSLFVMLTGTF